MELYTIYLCALIVIVCYFGFFYMWFNTLHSCYKSLHETLERKNWEEQVIVIKESTILEEISRLSRKIDDINNRPITIKNENSPIVRRRMEKKV